MSEAFYSLMLLPVSIGRNQDYSLVETGLHDSTAVFVVAGVKVLRGLNFINNQALGISMLSRRRR
jgi:hypothetical protein